MERKTIKFQYYRLFECCGDNSKLYDFMKLLSKICPLKLADRIKKVSNDKARLEDVVINKANSNFYAMRFMKLTEYALPHRCKENQQSEDIKLDDDEYIGQDVNVIYDKSIQVFLIQKNRGSLSIKALDQYLNCFYDGGDNSYLELQPILNTVDPQKLKNTTYKRIEFTFANLEKVKCPDSKNFKKLISTFNDYEGVNATVSISLGRTKKKENKSLNHETVNEAIDEVKNGQVGVDGLKLKYVDSDDLSQIYDLFDNILYETIGYSLEPRTTLAFDYCTDKMSEVFFARLPSIYKLIGIR